MDFDDINVGSDRISTFLSGKLNGIKSLNSEFTSRLEKRREISRQYLNNFISESSGIFIEKWFKKIINGKYVLGFEINNKDKMQLDYENTIIDFGDSTSITYKTVLIALTSSKSVNSLQHKKTIGCDAILLIKFNQPDFSVELSHAITGLVIFSSETKKVRLKLPQNIKISARDLTDPVLLARDDNADFCNFLARIFAGFKFEFRAVSKLSNNLSDLECFRRVNVQGNEVRNCFYFGGNIFGSVDYIVEIDELGVQNDLKLTNLNLYTINESSLFSFLHCFYNNTSDTYLIPKWHYNDDFLTALVDKELAITEFKKSVLQEIQILQSSGNKNNCDLIKSAVKTDVLYSKIKENT